MAKSSKKGSSASRRRSTAAALAQRVAQLRALYWGDLEFLVREFTALEEKLVADQQEAPDDDEDSAAHQTLARMRYFLANVSGTMDRLSGGPPPKGVKPYDMHQLGLLEKHITDNILPVKDRLLAQMAAVEAAAEASAAAAAEDEPIYSDLDSADGGSIGSTEAAHPSGDWHEDQVDLYTHHAGNGSASPSQGGMMAHASSGDLEHREEAEALMGLATELVLAEAQSHAQLAASDLTASRLVAAEMEHDEDDTHPLMLEGLGEGGEAAERQAIPDEDMDMVQVLATDADADEGADAGQDAGVKSEEEDEGDAEQQQNDISDLFAPMDFLQGSSTTGDSEPEEDMGESQDHTEQEAALAAHDAGAASQVVVKPEEEPAECTHVAVGQQPGASGQWQSQSPTTEYATQAADDDAMAASSAPAEKLEPSDQPTGMFLGKRDVDGEVVGAGGVRVRKRPRSSLMPVLTKEREVWYECALCKEHYAATISCNPWWALVRHSCPRCSRPQVPRIDIALPVNGIDHAQVLSACADDSDMEGDTDGGYSSEEEEDDDEPGEGAQLQAAQAAKLLVLMGHARECPGKHADPRHAEVCRSTKFLMLHIRDCNGLAPPTAVAGDQRQPCPHPWCKPCRNLLFHLVRCPAPQTCAICNPMDLPTPLRQLRVLNNAFRALVRDSSAQHFAPAATGTLPDVDQAAALSTASAGQHTQPEYALGADIPMSIQVVATPQQQQQQQVQQAQPLVLPWRQPKSASPAALLPATGATSCAEAGSAPSAPSAMAPNAPSCAQAAGAANLLPAQAVFPPGGC